jgi:hypothetical protein
MEPAKMFIQFLQSSITPVALISGVGLILLSLTNRIGRTIDRTRKLLTELRITPKGREDIIKSELKILHRRNRILKAAMGGIAFSILTSSLMIPVLLLMNIYQLDLRFLGSTLLILSISGIILAAIYFFVDIVLSLKAIDFEMKELI